MKALNKRSYRYLTSKMVLFIFLATLLLPIFTGVGDGRAFAAGVSDINSLALKAVRNNYDLYRSGQAVDGGWGNFGAYDAYVLTRAGVDLETWVYDGKSFKDSVLDLVYKTIIDENSETPSPAKRVAHEYLVAKSWGETEKADQLFNILKDRQAKSENGSFDDDPFSDMPAFEALGRTGDIDNIDTTGAINYILEKQDKQTGKWSDFMTTAQAVRALAYLKDYAGDRAEEVQDAIDKGINWIRNQQQKDGSFTVSSVWGGVTYWDDKVIDTAEVIYTLDLLGIDPAIWVSETGNSPVDYMKNGALNDDGTFGYKFLSDNTWALDAYLTMGANIADTVLVSPVGADIPVGGKQQYTAEIYKIGVNFEDITQSADWSVRDENIAIVNDSGLVTGVAPGDTVVTAIYQGVSGSAGVSVTGGGGYGGSNGQQGTTVIVEVIGKNGNSLFGPDEVTLRDSDRWGVTAMGALDKTGLSYELSSTYDNLVVSIAGQDNEGMDGWMYKVNGVVPAVLAADYPVSDNDRITWWYSTNPNDMPGDNIALEEADRSDDEKLLDALEETGEAKLNLRDKSDGQAFLSPDTIIQLANKNEPLVVENEGVKVEFAVRSLVTEELNRALEEENTSLKIVAREAGEAEKQEILSRAAIGESTGLFDIGGRIIELDAHIARTGDSGAVSTEKIEKFNEPVKVTIDLSGVELSDKDIANLTAVRFEEDAGDNIIPVQLGGTYDPDTKTFTFYTDRFSFYGVLKTKDRVRISLEIGKLDITVDDEVKRIDVPPTIVNNRTMVPLRFVSECLGADVEWIGETKTVAIELNDKKLRLVIGETGPGLDTPAIIINGRAFVPIRYVSESFNADVTWFPATKTVEIVK